MVGTCCYASGWAQSEIDLIAYNSSHIVMGECKCRDKRRDPKELDALNAKAMFVPVGKRKVYYLLASKQGFTDELLALQRDKLILADKLEEAKRKKTD